MVERVQKGKNKDITKLPRTVTMCYLNEVRWLCYIPTYPLWIRENGCAIFRHKTKCTKFRKFLIKISLKLVHTHYPQSHSYQFPHFISILTLQLQDNIPVEHCRKPNDFCFGISDGTQSQFLRVSTEHRLYQKLGLRIICDLHFADVRWGVA